MDGAIRGVICDVFSKAECLKVPYRVRFSVYDPGENTPPGTVHSAEQVYHTDFKELVESDFALFYLNVASLGVGIERQIAAIASVPSAVVCPVGTEISRMFEGTFSGSMFNVRFAHPEELRIRLANELATFGPQIIEKARRRRRLLSEAQAGCQVGKVLFKRRVYLQKRIVDLAKEIGIEPYWWIQLQRDTTGIIAATTVTPILASELRQLLKAGCGWGDSGFPCFNYENNLGQRDDTSLRNLYKAYVSRSVVTDDDVVLAVWKRQCKLSEKDNESLLDGESVSQEDWLHRFLEEEKREFAAVLRVDYGKLRDIEKVSFDTLYSYCNSLNTRPSKETLLALWNARQKDVKRPRRTAARKQRLDAFSVDDWRELFNKLDLVD